MNHRLTANSIRRMLRSPLLWLCVAFVANSVLWSAVKLANRSPDEPSHADYIEYLATEHQLPIYGETRYIYNPKRFNAHATIPPLYYVLSVPMQLATRDLPRDWQQQFAVRMISVLLGLITVILAYRLGRLLVPQRPLFGLACAAVVGFNPMFTFMSAAINSDNLITTIYAALMLLWAHGIMRNQPPTRRWLIGLGGLLGAGLLTKPTIVPGIVVSGMVLLWLAWRDRSWRSFGRSCMWVGAIALLLSGWWYVRNWQLYGEPTGVLLVGSRPDVFPQAGYEKLGNLWEMLFTTDPKVAPFIKTLAYSYWGIFDLMNVVLPQWFYTVLIGMTLLSGIGGVIWLTRMWRQRHTSPGQQKLFLAFVAGAVITLSILIVINVAYRIGYQPQGRYLFPAIVPLALMTVAGWEQLGRVVRVQRYIAPLLIAIMLIINVRALWTTFAPSHRTLAQRNAAPSTQTIQAVNSEHGGTIVFVAKSTTIESIGVLINTAPNVAGTVRWQLRDQQQRVLAATTVLGVSGVARYILPLADVRFVPATTYTLTLHVADATTTTPITLPFALQKAATPNDLLFPEIHYAPSAAVGLHNLDQALRSVPSHDGRARVQQVLYPLVPLLMLMLIGFTVQQVAAQRWRVVGAIFVGGGLLCIPNSSPGAIERIPTVFVEPYLPLAMKPASAPGNVVADVRWLLETDNLRQTPFNGTRLIQSTTMPIGEQTYPVLGMHPTSAITATINVPPRAYFHTGMLLDPDVRTAGKSDGVEFLVRVIRADGTADELAYHRIKPTDNPANGWQPLDIDLSAYANQTVQLVLATFPGSAQDSRYDWAYWIEPLVLTSP